MVLNRNVIYIIFMKGVRYSFMKIRMRQKEKSLYGKV